MNTFGKLYLIPCTLSNPGETTVSDWVFVCATSQLLPGEKAVAWADDTPILVVNLDGEFYAVEDPCTDDEFELSSGDVNTTDSSNR